MGVLSKKVLVLNKNWIAVGVISVERAITILFATYNNGEPKARIIEAVDPINKYQSYTWDEWSKIKPKDDEEKINASSNSFRVPQVIQLCKYGKIPQQNIHFSRRMIYKRDGFACQYCGVKVGQATGTVEHILPKSRNGKTTWENTCLACVPCNSKKANRTPEEAGMKLIRIPQKPKFNLIKEDVIIDSWKSFISEVFWNDELEK